MAGPSESEARQGLTVECRICGCAILLNQDTEAARQNGTDPLQQMRKHLRNSLQCAVGAGRDFGMMTDLLSFRPRFPDQSADAERYRHMVDDVLAYLLNPTPGEQSAGRKK